MAANRHFALLLTAPLAFLLAVLLVYPLIDMVLLAFTGTDWRPSLASFASVLGASGFGQVVLNTVLFTAGSTTLSFVLGLSLAWALDQITVGRRIFLSILILPFAVMPVVSGLTWGMMLNPATGVVNDIAASIGLPTPGWATATGTALTTVILIDVWQSTPFVILIAVAGFRSLPREPLEAAQLDGAGPLRLLRYVSLPMMRNLLLIALIFRLMDAFKAFDTIYVVTHGGPGRASETLVIRAFMDAFQFYRPHATAAIGVLLLLATVSATRGAGDLVGQEVSS